MNTLCGKKVLENPWNSDDPSNAHIEEGVRIKPITTGEFAAHRAETQLWTNNVFFLLI